MKVVLSPNLQPRAAHVSHHSEVYVSVSVIQRVSQVEPLAASVRGSAAAAVYHLVPTQTNAHCMFVSITILKKTESNFTTHIRIILKKKYP